MIAVSVNHNIYNKCMPTQKPLKCMAMVAYGSLERIPN